jgi:hypothetical protein
LNWASTEIALAAAIAIAVPFMVEIVVGESDDLKSVLGCLEERPE